MKYRKKEEVVVEAITFDELVDYGNSQTSSTTNGMPWSFNYNGYPTTHENNNCYLIATSEKIMEMSRGDMLITEVNREIYPCELDIFEKTYEPVENIPEFVVVPDGLTIIKL